MSDRSAAHVATPLTFRLTNMGPVQDAALVLGRLTVIAGGNNTGKTCIANALHGFIQGWDDSQRIEKYLVVAPDDFPSIEGIAETLVSRGRAVIPLDTEALQRQRRVLLTLLSRLFCGAGIREVFGRKWTTFQGARIVAKMNDPGTDWAPRPISVRHKRASFSMSHDGDRLIVTITEEDPPDAMEEVEDGIASTYYHFLMRDLFPYVSMLTSDRSGVILFHRDIDVERDEVLGLLQQILDDKTRDRVLPIQILSGRSDRHSLPVNCNLGRTRYVRTLTSSDSNLPVAKTLAAKVREMAGGYFRSSGRDIRLAARGRGENDGFDIPVNQMSSSARSLCDLYYYLRFEAEVGNLLIIDGPEGHLDTRNQIRMARLLARCVTAGVSVLVTTHSGDFLKELNNLIMLGADFQGRATLARRLGYQRAERLDPKVVRAYVAEDGGLTECGVGAHGIETSVLDEGRGDINEVAGELSSRVDLANRTDHGD